jgi:hypothetical protein
MNATSGNVPTDQVRTRERAEHQSGGLLAALDLPEQENRRPLSALLRSRPRRPSMKTEPDAGHDAACIDQRCATDLLADANQRGSSRMDRPNDARGFHAVSHGPQTGDFRPIEVPARSSKRSARKRRDGHYQRLHLPDTVVGWAVSADWITAAPSGPA